MTAALPQKAMLFAAGLGTRLRPLTLTTPKPLIDVNGKPLLAYALTTLQKAGVTDVMINTHHLGEQIPLALGDGSRFGLRLHYTHESVLLGTGGGLLNVKSFFQNEPSFWVMNSDTLLEVDLAAVWQTHEKRHADITLVVHTRPPQFGGVWINPTTDTVTSLLASPTSPSGNFNPLEVDYCGVSLATPKIFAPLTFAAQTRVDPCLMRHGFVPLLASGATLTAHHISGYFNDVGTTERLTQARTVFFSS